VRRPAKVDEWESHNGADTIPVIAHSQDLVNEECS
jgi:hypothetical protein